MKHVLIKIDDLLLNSLSKLPYRIYAKMLNFRSFVMGQKIRFCIDGEYIRVSDGDLFRWCKAKHQTAITYRQGFKRRVLNLQNDYHLNSINFSDGDVIIDCGANIGDLKLYFDVNEIKVQYFAFEPSPEEFSCLEKNVVDGVLINKGLWHCEDILEFYVSSEQADSSFIKPPLYTETQKVSVCKLDEYCSQLGNIKLLKLEAEGAEPEVLLGATRLLSSVEYISADVGFERGEGQSTTFFEVNDMLISAGFQLIGMNFSRLVCLYKNTLRGN